MNDHPPAGALAPLMITLSPATRQQLARFRAARQACSACDAAACEVPFRQMQLEAMILAQQIDHDVRQVEGTLPGDRAVAPASTRPGRP